MPKWQRPQGVRLNVYLLVYHAFSATPAKLFKGMAGTTGLEPAASAVTGQRSNQLNYVPGIDDRNFRTRWAVQDSNLRPPACK
jgi:hypothetical protein